MAGHSKWANMKHRKARQDAKKNKIFTKIIRELTVAARLNPDVSVNPRLRLAVDKALSENMTRDTIDRAIKRGAGASEGENYEELVYEGYGPNGVAIMIECLSDNRNRAASEVRVAVTRNGGSMADPGSVSYLFNRKGVIIIAKTDAVTEEKILESVLEAGAEEVNDLGESFEVVCEASDLVAVRTALQSSGLDYESADSSFLPSMSIPLDAEGATKVFELIDAIEELDDVQNVYSNFDVSDEVMASLS